MRVFVFQGDFLWYSDSLVFWLFKWCGKHKVGNDDNHDEERANRNPDPAVIVVVHDFADSLTNQRQPKKRGEDEEYHEERSVRIAHGLWLMVNSK